MAVKCTQLMSGIHRSSFFHFNCSKEATIYFIVTFYYLLFYEFIIYHFDSDSQPFHLNRKPFNASVGSAPGSTVNQG